MKKSYLLFLVFSLLWGCAEDSVPENLLSEDEMVKLLVLIHTEEAKSITAIKDRQIAKKYFEKRKT